MSRLDPASPVLDPSDGRPQSDWTLPTLDEVDLWWVDLKQPATLPGSLAREEQERVRRLRSPLLAQRLARSHLALRAVLARYEACSAEELRFARGDNGKPELAGSDWRFNLSHSADGAAVAVVRGARIGVDTESLALERRFSRIGQRFFSEPEYEVFCRVSAAGRALAFYRLWTRKEAYVKAWGTGLTFSSRRFSVALDRASGPLLLQTEMEGDSPEAWWFEERWFGDGHLTAACWEGGRRPLRCWTYQP